MKFNAWTSTLDEDTLAADYKQARGIGAVSVGSQVLFFRKRLALYYIPYGDIERCYRRVNEVPAQMGCCMGSYDRESLIVDTKDREQAVISLPDTRSARAVIDELRKYLPESKIGCDARKACRDAAPAAE